LSVPKELGYVPEKNLDKVAAPISTSAAVKANTAAVAQKKAASSLHSLELGA
jgi:hypothetical protein